MTTNIKDREAELQASKVAAFERFLSAPMTRMGMATIPPGDHQDALKLLLQSAFDAGSGHGMGEILKDLIGAMVKPPRD